MVASVFSFVPIPINIEPQGHSRGCVQYRIDTHVCPYTLAQHFCNSVKALIKGNILKKLVALLETLLDFIFRVVVALCIPPAIVMWWPSYKLWKIQNKSITTRNRKYYYLALLTAFVPGLGAFWGFEVLYVSLLQNFIATFHFSLPFLIADGDSFEYFASTAQAIAIICFYIALLIPTYSVMTLFYFRDKANVVYK